MTDLYGSPCPHLTRPAVSIQKGTCRHVPACTRRQQQEGADGGRLIVQRGAARPDTTAAVFIIFSWNYDLFWTSLQTYEAAGWSRRIIVIDNSDGHRLLHDPKVMRPD